MISVRLNLEVAKELESFNSKTLLSKNMIINRGTRLYIQLLRLLPEGTWDARELLSIPEFWELIKEVQVHRRVYWKL